MQVFWSPGPLLTRTAVLAVGASLVVWHGAGTAPSESVGVDHAVIEVVTPAAPADVAVDHAIIEVVTPRPPATIQVDHAIIEIVRTVELEAVPEDDDADGGIIGPILWLEWPIGDEET